MNPLSGRSRRLDEIAARHEAGDVEHKVSELRARRRQSGWGAIVTLCLLVVLAAATFGAAVGGLVRAFRWGAGL